MPAFRVVVLTVMFLLSAIIPVDAQLNPDLASPNIVINLPSRTLEFYSGNTLIKVYPIAIGKPSTPTPTGGFYVIEKEVNPWWFPPRTGEAIPSGPYNPLGYRWMAFASVYGIHGTNAPWAIGSAVSNGCIRMYEEDIEELFEVVPYGTPVRVTYDRVKVRIDSKDQASIGIYPDVYGYYTVTLAEVKNKLAEFGLSGLLTDGELFRLIDEEADRQVVFAQLHAIKVNGKQLVDRAITVNSVVHVPVWPVAVALGSNITWDEQSQVIRGEKRTVPATVKGDRIYVSATDAQLLFGGRQVWLPEENIMEIDVLIVFLNGKTLTGDVQAIDGVLAVPLQQLADALGQKLTRTPDNSLLVLGKAVPCSYISEQPYIQITKVFDVFGAYVYWNQQARSIELTYPFRVTGGND